MGEISRQDPGLVGAFRKIQQGVDGASYRSDAFGLAVIVSESREADGNVWRHVSYSRRSRMPEYADMVLVKSLFIGDDKKAIMVLPEKDKWVNIHKYCLHLWCCMDADPIPEFSGVIAGRRTI